MDYQLLRNGSTIQACNGGWLDVWGCYIDLLVSRAWNSHCPPLLKSQQELRLLLLSCVKVFINFRMHDLAAAKLLVSLWLSLFTGLNNGMPKLVNNLIQDSIMKSISIVIWVKQTNTYWQ